MFNNGYGNILFYSRSFILGYKMGAEPKGQELEEEYGDVPSDDDITLYWEDWQMTKDEHDKINDLTKMVDAIAIDVSVIKTVILGVPETKNGGLMEVVERNRDSISTLKKCFWVIIGVLIGTGILYGVQIYGV